MRMQAVCEAFERTVRGIPINHTDPNDGDAQFIDKAVKNLASRLRCLARQAAAGWRPEFTAVLSNAHSMRVEAIFGARKEGVRTEKTKCMACGRYEHRCRDLIDLAGPLDGEAWLGPVDGFADAYAAFKKNYESVYDETFECVECGDALPPQDLGSFTVGATCLRKAQLFYQVRTSLLELAYAAARQLEEVEEQRGELDENELYCIGKEDVQALMEKIDQLELSIADDVRPAPPLETDATFWDKIDGARDAASGCDEEVLLGLLRRRALDSLGVEDEAESDGADADEDEDCLAPGAGPLRPSRPSRLARRGSSRPAHRRNGHEEEHDEELHRSDGDEEDEEESAGQPLQWKGRAAGDAAPSKARQRRVVVDDADSGSDAEFIPGEAVHPTPACSARQAESSRGRGRGRARGRAPTELPRRSARVAGKRPREADAGVDAGMVASTRRSSSSPTAAAAPAPAPATTPTPSPAPDADEVGLDDGRAAAAEAERAPPAADQPAGCSTSSSARPGRRVAPSNAAELAATQRISSIAGRLPARRVAVLNLMSLQTAMMREGRDADAAACTNAIFVMQELLAKVEQMAHTV